MDARPDAIALPGACGLLYAYLARGGTAAGVRAGRSYVDVGTLHGYREAIALLSGAPQHAGEPTEDQPDESAAEPVTQPLGA